ncbi:Uncharacterized protein Rs2_18683 [Raphanus sativus]|nr:Uncharacterized protein Rs2_18683 [Raphanus sativus]
MIRRINKIVGKGKEKQPPRAKAGRDHDDRRQPPRAKAGRDEDSTSSTESFAGRHRRKQRGAAWACISRAVFAGLRRLRPKFKTDFIQLLFGSAQGCWVDPALHVSGPALTTTVTKCEIGQSLEEFLRQFNA